MIIKKTSDSKEPLNFQYIDCSGNAQTPNRLHRYIQTTEKSRLKGKRLPVLFCEAVILHLDMPFKGKASLCNYVCLNRRMMADEIWE